MCVFFSCAVHLHKVQLIVVFTCAAYKEKMKEISVLSLICSCLYPETTKNIMGDFEGNQTSIFITFFKHA